MFLFIIRSLGRYGQTSFYLLWFERCNIDWFPWLAKVSGCSIYKATFWPFIVRAIIWMIWGERNWRIFQKKESPLEEVLDLSLFLNNYSLSFFLHKGEFSCISLDESLILWDFISSTKFIFYKKKKEKKKRKKKKRSIVDHLTPGSWVIGPYVFCFLICTPFPYEKSFLGICPF